MQFTQLGRTGLTVSRLCLGTMNFGDVTSEPESFAIMDQAVEAGVNFFDTANCYGRPMGYGITEELIGRWLAQGGGRREKIVLATKVYCAMGTGILDRGLSARNIRRACDASLRRLQTDAIDLYIMHHVDLAAPSGPERQVFPVPYWDHLQGAGHGAWWDEIWQAMEQLVASGKVIYTGSSNFAAWQIAQTHAEAKARHCFGLVCEQSKYNLATRAVELEVIPACRALGLGLTPWSPVAGGLLGGVLEKTAAGRRSTLPAPLIEKHRSQLEAYEALCGRLGEKPANVALAWLLANRVVTAPVIGPRTLDQFTDSIRALDIRLSAETLAELERIWPGPGGEAPFAYAW